MSFTCKSTFATLPRTTRGTPMVISGDPKGKNFLYANGNSIIIRDLANPAICDVYTEHSAQTLVAKYSPSGYYIASGDAHGKIRIWDTTQKEHILKNEFQPLSGAIRDLAWSGDSQRIVVAGEGRDKFGHVFNAETGTSVGEISGASKALNAVDFKAERPYRIVTAGEDKLLTIHPGPPFKFKHSMNDHTKFVNAVRYSPDGKVFASGGADGRSFLYDGMTGELKAELGQPAHKGGIYAVSFSPDSTQMLSVSADKTVKIWDVPTLTPVTEYVFEDTVENMQVGGLWQGDYLLSVSLSGQINFFDKAIPNTPIRVLKGHNKPITALALNSSKDRAYTGSSDGKMCCWNINSGDCEVIKGKGHSNQVQSMVECDGNIFSIGVDDALIISSTDSNEHGTSLMMPSQPRGVAAAPGGIVVVACVNEVVIIRNGGIVYCHKADWEPSSAAIHPGLTQLAIGGGQRDMKVHIFTLDQDTLREGSTLEHAGMITDLSYSPDGSTLAVADANRRLALYNVAENYQKANFDWVGHMAKVNSLSWSPDSNHLISGALDTAMILWAPAKPLNYIVKRGAHPQYQTNRVQWCQDRSIISAAQDCCVKVWDVNEFP